MGGADAYGHDVNIAHYNAASGLFLLIEDRYGVDAIAKIGKEINELKRADGKDLVALCNRVIGTEIVELADSFYFPELGVETEALYPQNNMKVPYGIHVKEVLHESMAYKAGIKKGDVILKVCQKDVSTEFEFEYVIFKSLRQQQVPIEILREDKGILSLMLDIK